MKPSRERGRPARTKLGTAWAISPTWINRERRPASASAGPMRFPPAGRLGCNIALKLSDGQRDSMRAGRPRSRGCRLDGEVGGIRRATSLKAGLSPLGNSRLPASRAPALAARSFEEKQPIVNEDEPRMDTNKHK